ncbi:MAG: CTP synthase, partial [Sedimentisphaerales bacterium]|nr:CTP synthase [Sedimentisphaerales bacterium]
LFCNVNADNVIASPDVSSIYKVPIMFEEQKFGEKMLNEFGLKPKKNGGSDWKAMVKSIETSSKEVQIGVIGKYFSTGNFTLSDAYISVIEAIKHASWASKCKPVFHWLNSEEYEKDSKKLAELKKMDAVVIPGGFGSRGIEGKIKAIEYVRKHKIPYLGLCYGMQCAVIEYARNVLKLKDANTTEINPKTKNPVIHLMEGQAEKIAGKSYGGTLRLGAYDCKLTPGTHSRKQYGKELIEERHRHRYEFNNDYREALKKAGLVIAGVNPEQDLVEIIELKNHPYFVGVQFHPEFLSRPLHPHPLFVGLIKAAIKK